MKLSLQLLVIFLISGLTFQCLSAAQSSEVNKKPNPSEFWKKWGSHTLQGLKEEEMKSALLNSSSESGLNSSQNPELEFLFPYYTNVCSRFIDNNILGAVGQSAYSSLNDSYFNPLLDGSEDLRVQCPRYNQLNASEKKMVWALILGGIAYFESSCSPTASHAGIYKGTTAMGFYQLSWGREPQYAKRSSDCPRYCSKNPNDSTHCALSMLKDQFIRSNQLFYSKSYWEVLRPNGPSRKKVALIKSAINNFSLCK